MTAAIHLLWREHRIALLAFVAATGVMLFFLTRLVVSSIYWADPAHHDLRPQGWMTPRYIARSWDIAPEALRAGLGLPPQGSPVTLERIAADRGVPLALVLEEVARLIAAERGAATAPVTAPATAPAASAGTAP